MNLETKQFKRKLQAQVLVLHERKVLQKENFKIYKKKKKKNSKFGKIELHKLIMKIKESTKK